MQEEMLRENTEELLAANEEMRRTQVELIGQISALNNSSMVFETDMEGNIIYLNNELLNNLKYEQNELMGKRYTILKSPNQNNDKIYQEQWKSILNGKIWEGEVELKAKDGQSVWVWMTITPVLDSDGEPIKSINVLFDITPQKEQEFRLKRQQAALLEITSHPSIKEAKTEEAFAIIAQIGLATLEVDRASIWLFEENDTRIRCMTTAQSDGVVHKYQKGTVLQRDFYPNYFATLEKDRTIAANDAVNDPRTKELAIPLLIPSGIQSVLDSGIRRGIKTVGILSFESRRKSRNWTLDEQNFASSLADSIALVLEQHERLKIDKLKEAYAQLELINQQVREEKEKAEENATNLELSLKYAKRIQQNILPNKELLQSLFKKNYFVTVKPRDIVGGDFYWVAKHENKKVVVVADGTGHGVPGAFLTMIGNMLLNQIVNEKKILRPADILYWLHIGVRQTLKQDAEESTSRDGMDVTLVTIDMETYECEYAGANLPCNYYQDWEVHEIKPDKKSIGGEQMEEERTFTNHKFQLKVGDAVYLYTDGFVDQLGGPDEKRFSTRRFRDLILRTQSESMATQRALLNMEWKEWKGDREQLDDVTVFGFRIANDDEK
jgi:PAS domain S-box-containing protein